MHGDSVSLLGEVLSVTGLDPLNFDAHFDSCTGESAGLSGTESVESGPGKEH